MRIPLSSLIAVYLIGTVVSAQAEPNVALRGVVVDARTGEPLPCRVYVRSSDGTWHFVRSNSPKGSAVVYDKERQRGSVERHTTISAHPFAAELPPGRYTVRVERGKEYLPFERTIDLNAESRPLRIPLVRWIDMAAKGWYSGDTHVHRTIDELRNVMLAEDVNVGLPLPYWVTEAYRTPGAGQPIAANVRPAPIAIDPTHVIYPVNTEYEIFSVGPKRHTLGAVFILGHKRPFEVGVPPVAPIAESAHRQGALLDLDKHSWPWSMMLVPVMEVDLFELANNHVWQTQFGFRNWSADVVPEYMNIERDDRGFTERGWLDFGFEAYYTLLNCGFRLRPTAGTANGVHPVPLGFGRVYVHLPDGFSYEKWMRGLDAGRSFVTTGPMLMVAVDGRPPGATIKSTASDTSTHRITGRAVSSVPLRVIEIVVNGRVVKRLKPANLAGESGAMTSPIDTRVAIRGSSWIAVRCFEDRPDGRVRFAHGSPVHVDMPGHPLRPRREQVEYLIGRMKHEIERNQEVLRPEGLEEYRKALRIYEALLPR